MDADRESLSESTPPTTNRLPLGSIDRIVSNSGKGGRFRLPSPWRSLVERHRWVAVVGACFAVAILLLSSSVPINSPPSNSHVKVAGSSGSSTPQSAFLPYVLNTSQYPLPDTLLNATANISHPHVTSVTYLNQTIRPVTSWSNFLPPGA
jgi:hypothetical protein